MQRTQNSQNNFEKGKQSWRNYTFQFQSFEATVIKTGMDGTGICVDIKSMEQKWTSWNYGQLIFDKAVKAIEYNSFQ